MMRPQSSQLWIALVVAALFAAGGARAESVNVTDVGIGQPGDLWLKNLHYQRLERATQDQQHGYAATYRISGHGQVRIFWPRQAIDLAGTSPRTRTRALQLQRGRLWYPAIVTARSLPAVHRGVLKLEKMYARDVRGERAVYQALATIASLGAGAPGLRALPARTRSTSSGRMSSSSTSAKPQSGTSGTSGASSSGASGSATPGTVATTASTATAARSAAASPKALAKALIKAGHKRPPETAAHHIVAGNAKQARQAREILQEFGIGINEAVNGVFLPATRASVNPTGASVHSTLHTKKYYIYVNKMLESATTRAQAEFLLAEIRQTLRRGGL